MVKQDRPAEELGAVVERVSCQPEAHVQAECFWFCVECSDETGCCCCCLATLRLRLRVAARCGVLQSRVRLTVCDRLPLKEPQNIRAAVLRWNPARHLRGQRPRHSHKTVIIIFIITQVRWWSGQSVMLITLTSCRLSYRSPGILMAWTRHRSIDKPPLCSEDQPHPPPAAPTGTWNELPVATHLQATPPAVRS